MKNATLTKMANEPNTATATASESYQPTPEQQAVFNEISAVVDGIRESRGITDQSVKACEAYAKDNLSGNSKADEPNANHVKRITFASACLGVAEESILPNRATQQAVGRLMVALLFSTPQEEIKANYSELIRTEKTPEPSESETALATVFSNKMEVSKKLQGLGADDLKNVQSASHASFQTALKFLSPVDEKGKVIKETAFPQGAENFISYLIGASGGRTDEFALTDKMIAESSGMSVSSIKRHRQALEDWMHKTGKGIVSIKEATGQPTRYRVVLLDYTTAILEQMFSKKQTSSEALLTIAGLSGKLLSGQKLLGVGEKEQAMANELADSLKGVIASLPEPDIQTASNLDSRSLQATEKRTKKLLNQAEEIRTLANAAEHEAGEQQAGVIASELNEFVKAGDFSAIDTESFEKRLADLRQEVSNVTANDLDRAIGKMEAEVAAGQEISNATMQEYGEAFAATVSQDEAETVIRRELAAIRKSMFVIASLETAHGISSNAIQSLNEFVSASQLGAGSTDSGSTSESDAETTDDAPETPDTEEL